MHYTTCVQINIDNFLTTVTLSDGIGACSCVGVSIRITGVLDVWAILGYSWSTCCYHEYATNSESKLSIEQLAYQNIQDKFHSGIITQETQ